MTQFDNTDGGAFALTEPMRLEVVGEKTRPETKVVDGLTLQFDPDLNCYVLPANDGTGRRFVYDEKQRALFEVIIQGGNFIYRKRSAEQGDTKLTEEVLVATAPAADIQHAQAQKLKSDTLIALQGLVALSFACGIVIIVAFVWHIVANMGVFVGALAAGSVVTLTKMGEIAGWVLGLIVLFFVLWKGTPLLFRYGSSAVDEVAGGMGGEYGAGRAGGDVNITNIHVNNAKNMGGAQEFVNNRNF